ncbi:potassium channel family protein [Lentilactobacillus senioris]|uniref:potassium channel family protein n=1 Tax=Lentilactobacillus senioris TaxID=931534 RepID=UPI003D2CB561
MPPHKLNRVLLAYQVIIVNLALLSIGMVLASHQQLISLNHGPWHKIYLAIWLIFLFDYVIRFVSATSKKKFLIENLFDLIALIPSHPIFVFFRLGRVVSIIQFYHLFWRLGWSGGWSKKLHNFLYDTGFIYLFSISLVILISASLLFSLFEHRSLDQSLWWSVVTATTVGYGDVTPKSEGGKVVAAVLMFGGIGFIGLLTSTITDYFTKNDEKDKAVKAIEQLTKQVTRLSRQVDKLETELRKTKRNRTKQK